MRYQFKPMPTATSKLEVGSPEWIDNMTGRIQMAYDQAERYGVDKLVTAIRELIEVVPEPWEYFPEVNPVGDVEGFFLLVTGHTWSDIKPLVARGDPEFAEYVGNYGGRKKIKVATEAIESRGEKVTQQSIAEEAGLSQQRVSQITRCTPSKNTPKERISLSPNTDPQKAAKRIRERLGDDFADQLKSLL